MMKVVVKSRKYEEKQPKMRENRKSHSRLGGKAEERKVGEGRRSWEANKQRDEAEQSHWDRGREHPQTVAPRSSSTSFCPI